MTVTQGHSTRETPTEETVLRMTHVFSAERGRVFEAFVNPEQLMAWWGPKGHATPVAEVDLRPGGAYKLEMHSAEGKVNELRGVYREVDPPRKLVMTWVWQQDTLAGVETLVTLEFRDLGEKTEVSLVHELPTKKACDMHAMGWGGCFDCLADYLAES